MSVRRSGAWVRKRMSKIDKKALKIRLYDSDSDTHTETEEKKPTVEVSTHKNAKTQDLRTNKTNTSGRYSDDDDDDSAGGGQRARKPSLLSKKNDDDDKSKMKRNRMNHFSRPDKNSNQSRSSSSSSSSSSRSPSNNGSRNNPAVSSPSSSSSSASSQTSVKNNYKSSQKQTDAGKKSSEFERPKSGKVVKIVAATNGTRGKNSNPNSTTTTTQSSSSSRSTNTTASSRSSSTTSSSKSRSRSSSRSKSRSRSGSSTSTKTNSDDEDNSDSTAVPIKVNIERKPPIYRKTQKSNSLDKPSPARHHDHSDTDRQSIDSSNEMTDVSPLSSPKKSTHSKGKRHSHSETNNGKDTDRIDTTVFYNTLSSDFNKKMTNVLDSFGGKFSRPSSSKMDHQHRNSFKLNRTFDLGESGSSYYGSKLMRLEAENQKLYDKLLQKDPSVKRSRKNDSDRPLRITSSALNRQRDQQRIEKENQLILKRLLDVKPSRNLRKEEQIKDYERNFGYLSIKMSSSSPSGFLMNTSTTSSAFNRSNHIAPSSAASTKRSSTRTTAANSRVSSAKSTAKSHFSVNNMDPSEFMKRTVSLSRRPEWNDRW